jgi:hypothetical protein
MEIRFTLPKKYEEFLEQLADRKCRKPREQAKFIVMQELDYRMWLKTKSEDKSENKQPS